MVAQNIMDCQLQLTVDNYHNTYQVTYHNTLYHYLGFSFCAILYALTSSLVFFSVV